MSMPPQMIVRADAGVNIGNGHIMRCLALAAAWKQSGGEATFITHTNNATLKTQICKAGHNLRIVPDTTASSDDVETILATAREIDADWITLDGYYFDRRYQAAIKQAGYRLLVIDDNAHLPEYEADIILNQNLHSSELNYVHGPGMRLLLGPRYALLRPEFAEVAVNRRTCPVEARNLLITMGGADAHNVTSRVIQALNLHDAAHFETRAVVGPGNPHRRELDALLNTSAAKIELVTAPVANTRSGDGQIQSMADLMAWADIAISASGTTCWEMACLGLPALLIVTADNQIDIADSLNRIGSARNLGWHADISSEAIASALESLRSDRSRRHMMSQIGRHLADGNGAKLVADIMLSYKP